MENSKKNRIAQGENTGAMVESDGLSQDKKRMGSQVIDWINRVGRRNWIIVGAVLLIGLAVWLNWMFFSDSVGAGYADYGNSSGMTDDAGQVGDTSGNAEEDDYFATAQINRKRARDESMAVLQSVIDNPDATETVKNEALAEMNAMADEIEKEANIEALLLSGGFEDCVAVMNGETINVIVKSEGELQTAQIAKINTVVYEQTGIEPINVTIVHKN
jgi:hypothetical protein